MTITWFRVATACAVAAFAFTFTIPSLHAADIFDNLITDGNPSAVNPFTAGQTSDPNIAVSGIGFGPGVSANAGANRFNAKGWSATLDTTDYFTWTLTPNPNFEIDFNSLAGNWQRSGTGPNTYSLRSSLDGFSSELAGGAITGSTSAVAIPTINLSSIQHVTTAIEFRLYAFGNGAAAGTFSINDFTFDGSVTATSSSPAGLAGDYNNDGSVDAADYVVYRSSLETGSPSLLNETASPGFVDSADYDAWAGNFGATATGSGSLSSVSVPEPASALLLFTACCIFSVVGGKRFGRPAAAIG